jgi:hypothetical protein
MSWQSLFCMCWYALPHMQTMRTGLTLTHTCYLRTVCFSKKPQWTFEGQQKR